VTASLGGSGYTRKPGDGSIQLHNFSFDVMR
jgi:hypothetical protein